MAQSQKNERERLLTSIKEIFQVNNGVAPESLNIYYKMIKFYEHGINTLHENVRCFGKDGCYL